VVYAPAAARLHTIAKGKKKARVCKQPSTAKSRVCVPHTWQMIWTDDCQACAYFCVHPFFPFFLALSTFHSTDLAMAAPAYTPLTNPFTGGFPSSEETSAAASAASSFGLGYLRKFREERLGSLRPVSEFLDRNRFSIPHGLSSRATTLELARLS